MLLFYVLRFIAYICLFKHFYNACYFSCVSVMGTEESFCCHPQSEAFSSSQHCLFMRQASAVFYCQQ